MAGTSSPVDVSTKRQRIAEMSRRMRGVRLNTLAHHIDKAWLHEAWKGIRKDGATGIDEVSAEQYASNLDGNLERLLTAFKTGNYRAPPVRRVFIPKADGGERPLGIPTVEDKLLQRAITMVLTEVYEQEFLDCSYGFRRGRSQHMALREVWRTLMGRGGGMVLEVDIRSFFDEVHHKHLNSFLDERIGDGVIRRAIGKWLHAGVMEDGIWRSGTQGTPQGGVISPLLANIYLHHVLDVWFAAEVQPRMRGEARLVRYADDAVMMFSDEEDARRVMAVLGKRFERFGLRLHPDKTRLLRFRPDDGEDTGGGGSFDFLGFTHVWSRSRKGQRFVKQLTSKKRVARFLRELNHWCRDHRHAPVVEQHKAITRKLLGHYGYFHLPSNSRRLAAVWFRACQIWRAWLGRRSQRAEVTWAAFQKLSEQFPLPQYWQRSP